MVFIDVFCSWAPSWRKYASRDDFMLYSAGGQTQVIWNHNVFYEKYSVSNDTILNDSCFYGLYVFFVWFYQFETET